MAGAGSVGEVPMLRGRRDERAALDGLFDAARAGRSGVLVLRGEAGIGKTALLERGLEAASDFTVLRAVGVESDMELAFAALHQLCAPVLGFVDRLPAPQRDALEVTFGVSDGAVPDRFLVALAALSLFSEASQARPLVGVIDDAQWLDCASAQALGFVGRRLLAEPVVLLFAARETSDTFADLPELVIDRLDDAEARKLLGSVIPGRLDNRVAEQLVAEARGNPLALLELPRGLSPAQLAGGFGLPGALSLAGTIEQSFLRRLEALPEDTQRLLLVAAAEPLGDPLLLARATERLGIGLGAAEIAEAHALLAIGGRVTFRHPLVRSAVYRSADLPERRAVHLALAEATDRDADPDRRAWHLAAAAAGPDEQVALELERSAGRAQARVGVAAGAAFLRRAVVLTQDPVRRTGRALAAAQASLMAGAFDAALGLVAVAEAGPLDELQRARVDLLRGRVAFASGGTAEAARLLLNAAMRLEALDLELARETYLTAWTAGIARAGDVLVEICHAIRDLPRQPGATQALDLLLHGLALLTTDGRAAATPTLQSAAKALRSIGVEDILRWGWSASGAIAAAWDDEAMLETYARHVQLTRDTGALADLPIHLSALSFATAWVGDFAGAAALISELESVAAATGSRFAHDNGGLMRLRALQGREAEALVLIEATVKATDKPRQGIRVTVAHWAAAVLFNGLARYEEAASAARQAASNTFEPWVSMWALPELVEAAARSGDRRLACDALERLAAATQPAGTNWALGFEARCRALVTDGANADGLYREAIERLGRTVLRPELARAHLLYGEWLRREKRRVDARDQLRVAYDQFTSIGMEAFAERARRELVTTGETVRRRTVETRDELTAQERQIARLARDGLSNLEIGARLFLSQHTVAYHLRKVFGKLEISSRRQLAAALPRSESELVPA